MNKLQRMLYALDVSEAKRFRTHDGFEFSLAELVREVRTALASCEVVITEGLAEESCLDRLSGVPRSWEWEARRAYRLITGEEWEGAPKKEEVDDGSPEDG